MVSSTPHHQEADDINWGWALVSHNAENEAAPPAEIKRCNLGQTDINSPSPSLIDPAPQNSGSEVTSSFHVYIFYALTPAERRPCVLHTVDLAAAELCSVQH